MKTTIELPEPLLERVKILAVKERRKFKDMVAEILETGLRHHKGGPGSFKLPKPLRLRGGFVPTSDDIVKAMHEGRR